MLSRVFGIAGIGAALFLFLSPLPTVRRILRAKTIEEFSMLPYAAQICESTLWVCWAIATGDRPEMLINNIVLAEIKRGHCINPIEGAGSIKRVVGRKSSRASAQQSARKTHSQ